MITFTKDNTINLNYKGGIPVVDGEQITGFVGITAWYEKSFEVKIDWFRGVAADYPPTGGASFFQFLELPSTFIVQEYENDGTTPKYTEPTTEQPWPIKDKEKYQKIIIEFLEALNPEFSGKLSLSGFPPII